MTNRGLSGSRLVSTRSSRCPPRTSKCPHVQFGYLAEGDSQQKGISKVRGIEFEGKALVSGLWVDAEVSYLGAEDTNSFTLTSIAGLAYSRSISSLMRSMDPAWRRASLCW